jgi:hypothetical protein
MLGAHDPPLQLVGQLLDNLHVQFRCIGVDRRVAEQRGIEPASVDPSILRQVVLIALGLRASSEGGSTVCRTVNPLAMLVRSRGRGPSALARSPSRARVAC